MHCAVVYTTEAEGDTEHPQLMTTLYFTAFVCRQS